MLYSDVTELIGNTPLLRLDPRKHGLEGVELYAKLEFCNPFGSVKDRIAWGMIRDDLPGIISRGQSLIEASSGNTAKALQVLAAMHGIRLRVLTNRTKVPEVRDALELLGGELEELPGLSECPDPTVPNDVFAAIEKLMAENPGAYYHTSQYTNQRNLLTHHDTTGKEIFDDIGAPDFLFGGLGTTGSTRGAATYLRAANPRLRTVGIVSTRDDFIPGIRSEAELWEVGLFERDFYAEILPVCNAASLAGGIVAWRDASLPLESGLAGLGGDDDHRGAARARVRGASLAGTVTGALDHQAAPAVLMGAGNDRSLGKTRYGHARRSFWFRPAGENPGWPRSPRLA
jgi:cysteine synthase